MEPSPRCLGGGAASLGAEPPGKAGVEAPGEAEAAGEVELEGPGPGLVRGRAHERAGSGPKR